MPTIERLVAGEVSPVFGSRMVRRLEDRHAKLMMILVRPVHLTPYDTAACSEVVVFASKVQRGLEMPGGGAPVIAVPGRAGGVQGRGEVIGE